MPAYADADRLFDTDLYLGLFTRSLSILNDFATQTAVRFDIVEDYL